MQKFITSLPLLAFHTRVSRSLATLKDDVKMECPIVVYWEIFVGTMYVAYASVYVFTLSLQDLPQQNKFQ